MSLILVGTNHKYSPVHIREKLAFSKKKLSEALLTFINYEGIKAGVILSTCNRVELYADSQDTESGIKALKGFLSDYHQLELSEIEPYLYIYIGKRAIGHLFNVACGLDSQIVGEGQILEQVSFAYQQARLVEAPDRFLGRVFQKAIETGVRVRNETGISEGEISLGSLSVNLLKKELGSLKDKKILIIGVGKVSELVVESLINEEAKVSLISNKNIQRAFELAGFFTDAEVLRFDSLKEKLKEADIIISATSSPHLVLKKKDILEAISHKPSTIIHQPILIIDLAVPRDIDPEVKNIKGISLFGLDDLGSVTKDGLAEREREIPKAQKIIEEEVKNLCQEESLKLQAAEAALP